MPVYFRGAVEGMLDEHVLRRLVAHVGAAAIALQPGGGRGRLLKRLHGYNQAAVFEPWFVLVDLDADECAPALRRQRLPESARLMAFRVVVREVEAWLLGDAERFASFFGIADIVVPRDPEGLRDPKREIVRLCSASADRLVRDRVTPRAGSRREAGPGYDDSMMRFVDDPDRGWRPEVAARSCDSLARAIRDLERIVRVAEGRG